MAGWRPRLARAWPRVHGCASAPTGPEGVDVERVEAGLAENDAHIRFLVEQHGRCGALE
jgi:hypothetical protein